MYSIDSPIQWQTTDFNSLEKLPPQTLQIWRADLDQATFNQSQFWQWLAPDEQERGNRFRFERDRTRFICGRGIVRHILSQYLAQAPEAIRFTYSDRGKPSIATACLPPDLAAFSFNVSHSNQWLLCAIAPDLQVGIDLEAFRDIEAIKLAERFFVPSEQQWLKSQPTEQLEAAFYELWVCKEAYLKAVGTGLVGLADIEVQRLSTEPFVAINALDSKIANFQYVQLFRPQLGYAAAVVAIAPPVSTQYWQWQINSVC